MYEYIFHCKKCGYWESCVDKSLWRAAKDHHRRRGCNLMPLKDDEKGTFVLAREDLVLKELEERAKNATESNTSTRDREDISDMQELPTSK